MSQVVVEIHTCRAAMSPTPVHWLNVVTPVLKGNATTPQGDTWCLSVELSFKLTLLQHSDILVNPPVSCLSDYGATGHMIRKNIWICVEPWEQVQVWYKQQEVSYCCLSAGEADAETHSSAICNFHECKLTESYTPQSIQQYIYQFYHVTAGVLWKTDISFISVCPG